MMITKLFRSVGSALNSCVTWKDYAPYGDAANDVNDDNDDNDYDEDDEGKQ